MNMSHLSQHKRVAGFTLLELLVSMTLGLFLMAGLIQVLLANSEIFRVQENSSRMQEDGRFTATVLSRTISLTGYREHDQVTTTNNGMETLFPLYTTLNQPPAQTFLEGEAVMGANNDAGAGNNIKDGSDSIAVRYRGDGTTRDCLGVAVADGLMSVNRFFIDDDDTLNCRSDVYNPDTGAAVSTSSQPLIDNVEDMQIRYGMSTGGVFHDVAAQCYIDAGVVVGAGDDCTTLNYDQVVSVRISLLLHSGDDFLTPDNAAQTYFYEGANVVAGDSRLYRVMTTTIAMRNRIR